MVQIEVKDHDNHETLEVKWQNRIHHATLIANLADLTFHIVATQPDDTDATHTITGYLDQDDPSNVDWVLKEQDVSKPMDAVLPKP